ncbi:MAG: endonuclease III [Eggerthellaceae bacterium]|nr:endonuclease III [Eggerthellaceae bacterium]
MPRETLAEKRIRAQHIEAEMMNYYGQGECSLTYNDPFTLTIAVILSAQATDAGVNKVTPALFQTYPTAYDLAQAKHVDVEKIIRSLGFYKNKAKNIIGCAQAIVANFGGVVPQTMDELITLPGVGRKTANVVMCEAFKTAEGIAVDTHVNRIAHRLGFATKNDNMPEKVETKLLKIYPKKDWIYINHQWVHFGREYCQARNPKCSDCFVRHLCPSYR